MAPSNPNFDGIPLTNSAGTSGALFSLRDKSPIDACEILGPGIEVELRAGLKAVVVRGLDATSPESVREIAPELANQALDLLGMRHHHVFSLVDVSDESIVWWRNDRASLHLRLMSIATANLIMNVELEVRDSDGNLKAALPDPPRSWHESMRYFRVSQVTDDLFDAFRNVYLALESLLSHMEPVRLRADGRPAEGEGAWLRRALTTADTVVPLNDYVPATATGQNAADEVFDELYSKIRTAIFHAKSGRPVLLPQDFTNRTLVEEAKRRYTLLYLALAERQLGLRFPSGGFTPHAVEMMAAGVFGSVDLAATGDDTPARNADEQLSPRGIDVVTTPAIRAPDLDQPFEKYVRASIAAADVPMLKIGRFGVVRREDGAAMLVHSLDGVMSIDGFEDVELVIGARFASGNKPKTRYST